MVTCSQAMTYSHKSKLFVRSRQFAVDVFRLVDTLPKTVSGRTIADQLARSASSQAANYREARRARSAREFISKMGISLQEIEESKFWLEMVTELFSASSDKVGGLQSEADELAAMFAASLRTAKNNSAGR